MSLKSLMNSPLAALVVLVAILGTFGVFWIGPEQVLEIPFFLVAGWVFYLARVVPQWQPDGGMVATGLVCLLGFVAGSHLFLRWVYAATGPESGPRRWPLRWTLQMCGLVVLMFVAGVAATGVFHQTGWLITSPEPLLKSRWVVNDRIHSTHNLGQMAKAAHNFAAESADLNSLPVATFDRHGKPLHSWQTHILPFVEESNAGLKPDLQWDHTQNQAVTAQRVRAYLHPRAAPDTIDGYGASHYAGNAAVVIGDRPKNLNRDFPAGSANTIWVGEAAAGFRPWADPLNARDPRRGVGGGPDAFGSPVRGARAQFAMCDASVRTFDPKELAELMAGQVPE